MALNLRIVATTKTNLREAASAGRFREDLYYRLATLRLHVPPLRERGDDRQALFAVFLNEARATLAKPEFEPNSAVHYRLRQHSWPGNVRELRSYAYEAVTGAAAVAAPSPISVANLSKQVADFEAELIQHALVRHAGRVKLVIDELGIPRKTFYDKLTRYNIIPAHNRLK